MGRWLMNPCPNNFNHILAASLYSTLLEYTFCTCVKKKYVTYSNLFELKYYKTIKRSATNSQIGYGSPHAYAYAHIKHLIGTVTTRRLNLK